MNKYLLIREEGGHARIHDSASNKQLADGLAKLYNSRNTRAGVRFYVILRETWKDVMGDNNE